MAEISPSFIFFDSRYGDTYHVYLNDEKAFSLALRFTDSLRPPIPYSHLGDIPQPHRSEILAKLLKLSNV